MLSAESSSCNQLRHRKASFDSKKRVKGDLKEEREGRLAVGVGSRFINHPAEASIPHSGASPPLGRRNRGLVSIC